MFDPIGTAIAASMATQMNGGSDKNKYEWKPIIESTEFSFDVSDGYPYFEETVSSEVQPWDAISGGDVCKVVIDGIEYIIPADMHTDTDIFIGKHHEVNSDLPFMIWFSYDGAGSIWYVTIELSGVHGEGSTHTIAVYRQTEVIEPSGGGLPVVELETDIDGAGKSWESIMVESDWAKLTAIETADTPIIIKFVSLDFVENVVINKISMSGVIIYYGIFIDSEGVLQFLTLMHMPGSVAWMVQTKPLVMG